MAKFLQETLEDVSVSGTSASQAAMEFTQFFNQVHVAMNGTLCIGSLLTGIPLVSVDQAGNRLQRNEGWPAFRRDCFAGTTQNRLPDSGVLHPSGLPYCRRGHDEGAEAVPSAFKGFAGLGHSGSVPAGCQGHAPVSTSTNARSDASGCTSRTISHQGSS